MNRFISLALAGAFLSVASLAQAAGSISIEDAWARASIGKARAGIAYVTVKNTGTAADHLVGASGDVARKVELHTHIRQDDIMMMRRVESIEVPAGGEIALKPGGYHVMLIGLKAPLKFGETFPLSLTFEKAGTIKTMVSIQKPAARKMMKK